MKKIKAIQSDITSLEVDAIINPANSTLLGGGGCDGAIHQAAGPDLLEECKTLNGCDTGEAKITKGYNLSAKYIIHTVGPVFGQENGREKELLTNCYINSFELAKKHNIKTIAFPGISTGVFRYPKDEATEIAINIAKRYMTDFDQIIFVCYLELDYNIYQSILNK